MKLSLANGQFKVGYNYYGQMGEDKHIHTKYFPSYRNGIFLELGALDGVKYSNTKFFEDSLNWTGVLIEPIPSEFEKLVKNRPKCSVYHAAISEKSGYIELYNHGAVSSVKDNTTIEFFNGWHEGKNIEIINVPARRLDSILHDAKIKRIDFWSLDVEGSELEVLSTMDWSIPVYLICIETQESERKKQCDAILLRNGFIFIENLAHNEIWINPSNKRT